MNDKYIKPPIGIINRNTYETFLNEDIIRNGGMCVTTIKKERMIGLKGAIERYLKAKMHIDIEWVLEYNELLDELGVKKIEFKL